MSEVEKGGRRDRGGVGELGTPLPLPVVPLGRLKLCSSQALLCDHETGYLRFKTMLNVTVTDMGSMNTLFGFVKFRTRLAILLNLTVLELLINLSHWDKYRNQSIN